MMAQRAAPAAQIVDLRRAAPPALRLSALESCPLTFASASELPEGLVSCAGAIRLKNGSVVIVDGTVRKILIFDSTGKLLSRVGRTGQGPGEFSGTPRLYPYRGDSLLLHNWSAGFSGAFQAFSGAGAYARSIELDVDRSAVKRPAIVGASLNDGSIRVSTFASTPPAQGRTAFLDSVRILSFDPLGRNIGGSAFAPDAMSARDVTVTQLPAASGRSGARMSMRSVSAGPVSRARAGLSLSDATLAVHGGPLYHFEEPTDALVVYAPDGGVVRRILLPPLEQRMRPAPNRIVAQTEAQMLQVISDDLGRAWVELARENAAAPRKWWIVDQSGVLVAEVVTPARQEVLFAGHGRVLLLRKDENDGQTVVQCMLVTRTVTGDR
jgi:hypothetical protein